MAEEATGERRTASEVMCEAKPDGRDLLFTIEGEEKKDYDAAGWWVTRCQTMLSRMFDLLGTAKIERDEATAKLRRTHGFSSAVEEGVFYERATGRFYRRR